LINDHLFGNSSKIIKPVKQRTILENDIFIATGRKNRCEDEKLKTASTPVLPKIKLHMFHKWKFRNFHIGPYFLIQPQLVCLDKITYVIPQGLFIARKSAVSFFQIIINSTHIKLLKFILLIHFQDVLLIFLQNLIPKYMLPLVSSKATLIHPIILGRGPGIYFQLRSYLIAGIPLMLKCFNLFVYFSFFHFSSCKAFKFYRNFLKKGILLTLNSVFLFTIGCIFEFTLFIPKPLSM